VNGRYQGERPGGERDFSIKKQGGGESEERMPSENGRKKSRGGKKEGTTNIGRRGGEDQDAS